VKLDTKKIEDPQNDKKKFKVSETSKYRKKTFQSSQKKKANIPLSLPLAKLHTMFFEDPQNLSPLQNFT
jgi:hypothetical protein